MSRFLSQALMFGLVLLVGLGVLNVLVQPHASHAESGYTREDIEKIIHDYLMEHPEVILESVSAGQEKQQAGKVSAALEEYKDYLYNNIQGLEAGNPDGDVTIVEFFDYNCGYCKRVNPIINQILEEDKNVRVIFVEFPILGESSYAAARYALAANKQGRYAEFHNQLMSASGALTENRIEQIAKGLGLDMAQLKKDMQDTDITNMLQKNHSMAQDFGITGTPAFLIGDTFIGGAMSYAAMKSAIRDARDSRKDG